MNCSTPERSPFVAKEQRRLTAGDKECVSPPIPAPPEVAEGKPFNEQGFAVTEFKCIRLSLWRNSGFGGPRISSVVFFKKPQWGAVATGSHH